MPYFFGLHAGHLIQRANVIAARFGAEHVNFTEPSGQKRGWFSCQNRGAPFDQNVAKAVLHEIELHGGFDALTKKRGGQKRRARFA